MGKQGVRAGITLGSFGRAMVALLPWPLMVSPVVTFAAIPLQWTGKVGSAVSSGRRLPRMAGRRNRLDPLRLNKASTAWSGSLYGTRLLFRCSRGNPGCQWLISSNKDRYYHGCEFMRPGGRGARGSNFLRPPLGWRSSGLIHEAGDRLPKLRH